MTDRNSFLKGYLLGKILKLPPLERPATISPSAASEPYERGSFLSGLAAALSASATGLSGTWNALNSQFVTFSQWAAHFGYNPVSHNFYLQYENGELSFEYRVPPYDPYFSASLNNGYGSTSTSYWAMKPYRISTYSGNPNAVINSSTGSHGYFSVPDTYGDPYNVFEVTEYSLSFSRFSGSNFERIGAVYIFEAPVAGVYTRMESPAISGTCVRQDQTFDVYKDHSAGHYHYLAGQSVSFIVTATLPRTPSGGFVQFFDAIYIVVPDNTQTLQLDSRPGSVEGDYGVVRSDGTIQRIYSGILVRESDGGNIAVFNPVRNLLIPASDWSYDYATRTYTFTTTSGTLTLSYGDNAVSIEYGGVTDRLAYAIMERPEKILLPDSSSSGSSTPDSGSSTPDSGGDSLTPEERAAARIAAVISDNELDLDVPPGYVKETSENSITIYASEIRNLRMSIPTQERGTHIIYGQTFPQVRVSRTPPGQSSYRDEYRSQKINIDFQGNTFVSGEAAVPEGQQEGIRPPGRTIYGGWVDLVTGEILSTHIHAKEYSGLSLNPYLLAGWNENPLDVWDPYYITGREFIWKVEPEYYQRYQNPADGRIWRTEKNRYDETGHAIYPEIIDHPISDFFSAENLAADLRIHFSIGGTFTPPVVFTAVYRPKEGE